jgi:hypothetical protein
MNRLALGIVFGVAFGILDVLMTLRGNHPTSVLCQAFFSRFALGVLATTVDWRMNPVITGALVGVLVSLPDAFALKSYTGILLSGVVFGAVAGFGVKGWARRNA